MRITGLPTMTEDREGEDLSDWVINSVIGLFGISAPPDSGGSSAKEAREVSRGFSRDASLTDER